MFIKNKNIDYYLKKLNSPIWKMLNENQQAQIILNFYNSIKEQYVDSYIKKGTSYINEIKFVKIDNTNILGSFHSHEKILYINTNRFLSRNYANALLITLLHEIYHAYQLYIYEKNTNELYSKIYFNNLVKFQNYSNLYTYIHYRNEYNILDDLTYLFYHLNPIERNAFLYSENLASKYISNIDFIMPKVIILFNLKYKRNYTQEEVFNIIDECYDRLYKENYINMREIVANVLYDMQQIILLENDKYTAKEVNQNLKNKYNPTKLLEQSKTDTPIKCPYIESIEQFRKLDSIQQVNNPKVVYKAVINFQESVIPYINNIPQLENILDIYSDILSDKCKETINNQMKNLTNRENKQNHILDEK